MSSHSHYSISGSFDAADFDHQSSAFEVGLDERIGPPLPSRRAGVVRRLFSTALIAGMAGGGWWALQTWPGLPAQVYDQAGAIMAAMTRQPAIEEPPLAAMVPTAAIAPIEPVTPLPAVPAVAVAPPVAPADPQEPATTSVPTEEPPPRLPPPKPDPADPNQKKAVAAGLHPGLSPALLARLTETDFRNATTAIKTALADTPEGGELVWPREAKGNLARFHIHFVRGADGQCRRYVVAVLKDGWKTTALPMEKCRS